MEKIPKVPALRSELERKAEYSSELDTAYLLKLKDRDDLVIREIDWLYFLNKGYFRPTTEKKELAVEDFAALTKQHFDELRSYGIDAPVSFVVAQKEGADGKLRETFFAVVDNVERTEASKDELGKAFVELRRSLLKYYTDKLDSGESFLADLYKHSQYVYGSIRGETPRVHLVDVEPFIYGGPQALERILIDMNDEIFHESGLFSYYAEYAEVSEGFERLLHAAEEKVKASNASNLSRE